MLRMCDAIDTIRSTHKQGRLEELESIIYGCLKSEPCENKVELITQFCQDPQEIQDLIGEEEVAFDMKVFDLNLLIEMLQIINDVIAYSIS